MNKLILGFLFEIVLVLSIGCVLHFIISQPEIAPDNEIDDMLQSVSNFMAIISYGIASLGFGLGYIYWFVGFSRPTAQEAPLMIFMSTLLIPTALFIALCMFLPITNVSIILEKAYGIPGYVALLLGSALAGKIFHFVSLSIIYRNNDTLPENIEF